VKEVWFSYSHKEILRKTFPQVIICILLEWNYKDLWFLDFWFTLQWKDGSYGHILDLSIKNFPHSSSVCT
jgi:hypothetical protein